MGVTPCLDLAILAAGYALGYITRGLLERAGRPLAPPAPPQSRELTPNVTARWHRDPVTGWAVVRPKAEENHE